jgi:hypothetical protein
MAHLNSKAGLLATVAVFTAAIAPVTAAHADAQYTADRAYCMSGRASEARDLCLKEAAAAQAERQKKATSASIRHRDRSTKNDEAGTPGMGAGKS